MTNNVCYVWFFNVRGFLHIEVNFVDAGDFLWLFGTLYSDRFQRYAVIQLHCLTNSSSCLSIVTEDPWLSLAFIRPRMASWVLAQNRTRTLWIHCVLFVSVYSEFPVTWIESELIYYIQNLIWQVHFHQQDYAVGLLFILSIRNEVLLLCAWFSNGHVWVNRMHVALSSIFLNIQLRKIIKIVVCDVLLMILFNPLSTVLTSATHQIYHRGRNLP